MHSTRISCQEQHPLSHAREDCWSQERAWLRRLLLRLSGAAAHRDRATCRGERGNRPQAA